MAEITGLTAARMKEIEDAALVSARIDSDELILVANDGTEFNLGNVRGAKGDTGPMGEVTSGQLSASDAAIQALIDAIDGDVGGLDTAVANLQSTVNSQGSDLSTAEANISSNDSDISSLTSDLNAQEADFVRGTNPEVRGSTVVFDTDLGVTLQTQTGSSRLRYPLALMGKQGSVYSVPSSGGSFVPLNDTEISFSGGDSVIDLVYQVDAFCTFSSGLLAVALYRQINSGSWTLLSAAPQVIIRGDSSWPNGGRCTTATARYIDTYSGNAAISYKLYASEVNGGFAVSDHTQLSAVAHVGYQGFIL